MYFQMSPSYDLLISHQQLGFFLGNINLCHLHVLATSDGRSATTLRLAITIINSQGAEEPTPNHSSLTHAQIGSSTSVQQGGRGAQSSAPAVIPLPRNSLEEADLGAARNMSQVLPQIRGIPGRKVFPIPSNTQLQSDSPPKLLGGCDPWGAADTS